MENKKKVGVLAFALLAITFVLRLLPVFDLGTSVIPGWYASIFPSLEILLSVFNSMLIFIQLALIIYLLFFKEGNLSLKGAIIWVNILILISNSIWIARYFYDISITYFSGYLYEQIAFYNRALGAYWWNYVFLTGIYALLPLLFLSKKLRNSIRFTSFFCLLSLIAPVISEFVSIWLNNRNIQNSVSYWTSSSALSVNTYVNITFIICSGILTFILLKKKHTPQ